MRTWDIILKYWGHPEVKVDWHIPVQVVRMGLKANYKHFWLYKALYEHSSDQNTPFQCPISLPKGKVMSLNTFLTLLWYFIHFFDPKSTSGVVSSIKIAYFGPLGPYKEKWLKNVIFHDFFKVFLDVPRCYPRYVKMFLGPLEGVLSLIIHFWPVS